MLPDFFFGVSRIFRLGKAGGYFPGPRIGEGKWILSNCAGNQHYFILAFGYTPHGNCEMLFSSWQWTTWRREKHLPGFSSLNKETKAHPRVCVGGRKRGGGGREAGIIIQRWADVNGQCLQSSRNSYKEHFSKCFSSMVSLRTLDFYFISIFHISRFLFLHLLLKLKIVSEVRSW